MADLVRRRVALIATPAGNSAAQVAKAATTTIPIVFGVSEDPVKLGLVASLARPGANATGINFFVTELTAKRLALLHELVPKAVRVGVLVNPANIPATESTLRDIPDAARAIGLQIQVLNASTRSEIEAAFATLVRDRADALYVAGSSLFTLGFGGDVTGATRAVVVAAGAAGLGLFAVVIAYLPGLYQAFNRREVGVLLLDARAGSPPSGPELLHRTGSAGVASSLPELFEEWERWVADVLETHMSYPLLALFRSPHDNTSWVTSLGAVLDAATLLLTTVEDEPNESTKLLYGTGVHAMEDLFYYLRLHGRNTAQWWTHEKTEDRYNYLYSADELEPFAAAAGEAARAVKKAYLYTNNHYSAKSIANAAEIKVQLGEPLEGGYRPEFLERYPHLKTFARPEEETARSQVRKPLIEP